MRTYRVLMAAWLILSCGVAYGQYVPIRVVGEGEAAPDTGDNIVTLLGQHCVTSTGQIAVELDDAGPAPTDDFFWVDGTALYRAGTMVTGSASPTDFVDNFDTYSQLNDSLQLVWVGDDANGDFLALDGVGLSFDGDSAPGISGRVLNDYNEPCVDAAGNIYFRADLDGATTDDEVIYFVPVGGAPLPLELGIGSGVFREGQLIIGGPLDGMMWDDAGAFLALECSDSGVLLMEADVETATEVLVRKQPGLAYELLVSEGDMFMAAGGMAPIENINQISQARGNLNWAIDAKFDDTITGATADDVILADVGAGIVVVAEEGADVSAVTSIPGTTLGFLSQVSVNSAGTVIYLADIQDDGVNIPPYDEAIFQWDAGVTTLIITDEVVVPSSGNTMTNLELDLVINDQDRIFFQADEGTSDVVFEAFLPAVFSVLDLACMPTPAGTEVEATWTIPTGPLYDGIRIYVNGALETTLGAGELTYTTATFMQNLAIDIEVEPFAGPDSAPIASCSSFVTVPPDFTECRTPMPGLPIDSVNPPQTDILSVLTNVPLADLTLSLNITHTFQGDLDIDLTSPLGTNVVLTTDNGGALDNVDCIFGDFGVPLTAASDLAAGIAYRPEGPGAMADFQCENSQGDWVLGYDDDAGGDTGTLDMWCVNIYEELNPGNSCCPRPSTLSCANVGGCGGPGVNVAWQNNDTYNALELVRDDGMTQTTIALASTATSFSDTAVVDGESYTYTLRYQCAAGGPVQDSETCSATVNLTDIPPVQSLDCVADACGTNTVTLTWANGATYDTLTLSRSGVFLADVTGLTSFVDTTPNAGTSTYSLVADCGGVTTQSNCVVANEPPPVTDLVCAADFCTNEVDISWNTNGVPYDTITLNRGGVFLADVTGLSSFTDMAPLVGTATYTVAAGCNGNVANETCAIDNSLLGASDLVCTTDTVLCDGLVSMTWLNNATYDSLDLLVDGVAVTPGPAIGDTMASVGPLTGGPHVIELVSTCLGMMETVSCNVDVFVSPSGTETDLILALEGAQSAGDNGDISSASALATALIANGREVYVTGVAPPATDIVTGLPCGVDLTLFDTVWVMTGTFPDDYRITMPEGDLIASLAPNANIYFEGADQWGFEHVDSALDERDGIEQEDDNDDGDDSFTQMDGQNAPTAMVDLSALQDINYNQDQALTDWTDQLSLTGSTPGSPVDTMVTSVEPLWINSADMLPAGVNDDAIPYVTAVIAVHMDGGIMLSQSWEFGGYAGDQVALAAAYLAALDRTGGGGEDFKRGDCNNDDSFNIADAVYLLGNLFPPPGGTPNALDCLDACDGNDDGALNIADAVRILGALFTAPGMQPDPLEAPGSLACGADPTMDAIDCSNGVCP